LETTFSYNISGYCFRLFSNRQLDIVESRLNSLEAADEDSGFVIEELSETTVAAMQIYLNKIKHKKKGKFLFYGLPAGKFERLIHNRNATKIDEEGYDSSTFSNAFDNDLDNAELEFRVRVNDELIPGVQYQDAVFVFPLAISIDEEGI